MAREGQGYPCYQRDMMMMTCLKSRGPYIFVLRIIGDLSRWLVFFGTSISEGYLMPTLFFFCIFIICKQIVLGNFLF